MARLSSVGSSFLLSSLLLVGGASAQTDERLQKLLERFPAADTNKDGKLSLEEAQAFRQKLTQPDAAKAGADQKAAKAAKKAKRAAGPELKPDHADVSYGPHPNNKLDLWLAKSEQPAPLVVFIHGGGFVGGDKSSANAAAIKQCLDAGVSFASINYRFRTEASINTVLRDCARAVQFLRSKSGEYRLDKSRVGAFGGSAGAGTSLWLAFRDDLADPKSDDPVLRESTRLIAAGSSAGQASYDILKWEAVLGSAEAMRFYPQATWPAFYGLKTLEDLQTEEGKRLRADVDMLGLISKDDPPVWLGAGDGHDDLANKGDTNHSPKHSEAIKKRCDEIGVPCVLKVGAADPISADGSRSAVDFLMKQIQAATTYDEVELLYPQIVVQVAGKSELVFDKTQPPLIRYTRTFRRTRGSEKPELLRLEREYLPPVNDRLVTNHERGQLHGPTQNFREGKLIKQGQYERGLREGVWTEWNLGVTYTIRWHKDRLDGLYEKQSAAGHEQMLFKDGRLIGKSGAAEPHPLLDFLESDKGDDFSTRWIVKQLRRPVELGVKFDRTPLLKAVNFLQDANGVPFEIDRHRVRDVELPITADYSGLDLCSTLALTLGPHGLACDCRYGTLWVTTKEDARGWRDPTGVSEVKPPPASVLATHWNRILTLPVEVADLPLATVLGGLAKDLNLQGEIDVSRVRGDAFNVTANIRGEPLRHALGILLYKTNCRCRLENGKLVILPPDAA